MLKTFELHQDEEVHKTNLEGVISAIIFAMHATVHSTSQSTPMQLVFGRDVILNVQVQQTGN